MMTDKPENPPAFPVPIAISAADDIYYSSETGMTLRDYAVIHYSAAIMGNIESSNAIIEGREPEEAADILAKVSAIFADAMLKEREK